MKKKLIGKQFADFGWSPYESGASTQVGQRFIIIPGFLFSRFVYRLYSCLEWIMLNWDSIITDCSKLNRRFVEFDSRVPTIFFKLFPSNLEILDSCVQQLIYYTHTSTHIYIYICIYIHIHILEKENSDYHIIFIFLVHSVSCLTQSSASYIFDINHHYIMVWYELVDRRRGRTM